MAAQLMKEDKRKQRPARKIDRKKVEELRDKGLTITDIAEHQQVTPATIYRYLTNYTDKKEKIELTKNNMAGLLMQSCAENMEIAHRIKQNILTNWETFKDSDYRLQKEVLIAVEGGRHYNYLDYRLETDQSTENQAVLVQAISEARNRKVEGSKAQDVIDVT